MSTSTIFERSDLIGKRAAEAVAEAIEESLDSGVPVVYAEEDIIYREYPDGRREQIGEVDDRPRD